jgi:TonB family protein
VRQTTALWAIMTIGIGIGLAKLPAQDKQAQEKQIEDTPTEFVRRAKSKAQPEYPELARKMNITGTMKVAVVVAANGTVKEPKVVGGHPLLATSALEAARKWRFEPAATESSGTVDFKFEARQ